MDIENVIKEHKLASDRLSHLSFKIGEHFKPIIQKLLKNKDRKGLEALISKIPECTVKLFVYQSLRELKEQKK